MHIPLTPFRPECILLLSNACDTAREMSRYQAEWDRMRSRRNRIFLLLVTELFAFPSVGIVVATVGRRLFSTTHALMPASIIWGVLLLLTDHRLRISLPKVWQQLLREDRRSTGVS